MKRERSQLLVLATWCYQFGSCGPRLSSGSVPRLWCAFWSTR